MDSRGDSVLGEQCGSVAKITKETCCAALAPLRLFSKETSANAERYPLFSKETSANAERYPLFCHALPSGKARNDRGAVDYRATASTPLLAQNLWITKEAAATPCFATPLKRLAMTGKS